MAPRKKIEMLPEIDELEDPLRFPPGDERIGRLLNAWLMYKDQPCYADRMFDESSIIVTFPLVTGPDRNKVIHSSSVHLNINHPALGYVNSESNAYYVKRTPKRKNRAGLHPEFCQVQIAGFDPRRNNTVNLSQLSTKDVAKMLLADYPTLESALLQLKSGKSSSVAFSRYLAMKHEPNEGNILLFYKNKFMGFIETINWKYPRVLLMAEFEHSFFTNMLIEHGIGV